MATGGLGMGTAPASAPSNLLEQKLRAEAVVKAAAGWFLWVAALSVVNSFLSMSGSGIRFIFGLGAAQIIDALAHQAGSSGVVLDLIINGFVAGVLLLFWNFARKGEKWAFIVGMALYAVDGLILLSLKEVLGTAFHAYALYRMYRGIAVIPVLQRIEQAMAPAGAPIVPKQTIRFAYCGVAPIGVSASCECVSVFLPACSQFSASPAPDVAS